MHVIAPWKETRMIESTALFTLTADVDAALDLGNCGGAIRRIVAVNGGRFEGERLSGLILPGGNDVQRIRGDGVAELQIHVALRTHEGDSILFKGHAIRYIPEPVAQRIAAGDAVDPDSYYFREAITFETSSARLSWLNRIMALGIGRRNRDSVELEVFEVL
ncbi:MAG: DUF3237 domain-containing protein [Steroidobacteraceae bacterium]